MSERPPYEPPPPTPPMSAQTGDRIVVGLGAASAFIGFITMAIERATDLALAHALGVNVFLATPLGVAALAFIPITGRVGRAHAVRQAVFAAVFWAAWIYWRMS